MKASIPLLLALAILIPAPLQADWLQFRGPGGSGVAETDDAPATFSDDSVTWKIDLPGRGLSSPLIVGDQVFVTCSSGPDQQTLHVFCLDDETGKTIWKRTFRSTGRTMTHKKTNVAAPTPCSDGEHIFALYSSNDLICLDLDGNLKWMRGLMYDYPNASNSLGMASSPVFAGDTLVVQSENDSDSFALGIDPLTGTNLWKKARPKSANWTSPIVLDGDSQIVALQSSKGVIGVVPATGSEVFNFEQGASTIPSSTVGPDGVLYVPSRGITALKLGPSGAAPEELWTDGQLAPGTGSPLVIGDKLFTINKAGVLSAAETTTGERIWRIRTEGPYSGSPIASGSRIYLFNEQGLGQIVETSGEEGEVVSTIALEDTILCTPSIANGAVYVRSDGALWKLK